MTVLLKLRDPKITVFGYRTTRGVEMISPGKWNVTIDDSARRSLWCIVACRPYAVLSMDFLVCRSLHVNERPSIPSGMVSSITG